MWCAGSFRLSHDRKKSARKDFIDSIHLFGVWNLRDCFDCYHVCCKDNSGWIFASGIWLDLPARSHSTTDRAFHIQLATQIFICHHGRSDNTCRANWFCRASVHLLERITFTGSFNWRSIDSHWHLPDIETGYMTLSLTAKDREMLRGDYGPATKMVMTILVRMAEVSGANELLDIIGAHIDSTVYIGDAGLEFAERLANLGARVAVPTTLNVSGLDEHHWQEWAVPNDWASQAHRQMIAYQSMGTIPTWTCAPYQTEMKPSFGQQIAWGESNAICFANTVIGARTERYPDLFDICCAITGRAPAMGLHLTENRAGTLLLQLENVPIE